MPKAAILGFDDSYASVLGGFADMLQVANAHLRRQEWGKANAFTWDFLSDGGGAIRASNGLELATQPLPLDIAYDIVFIPSLHYRGWDAFQACLDRQAPVRAWLVRQWERGAWVVANCTGTFILADTGLLDRRTATTTWWLESHFRARFPEVELEMRSVVTEAERMICGGAHATFALQSVRVISRFVGKAVAMQCARSMLIDMTQTTRSLLLPLMTERDHNDPIVHRAQKWLQERMAEPVRIASLAAELAVSERTLIRRFNAALGQSPLTYLQHLRLDTARALLEAGDLSIEQITAYVGYGDISSFTRLFRERVGCAPRAYRDRFQLEELE